MNKNLMFGAIILILSSIIFITINLLDSFETNLDKEAIEKADQSLNLKQKEMKEKIIVERSSTEHSFVTKPPESQEESINKPENIIPDSEENNNNSWASENNIQINEPIVEETEKSNVIENIDNGEKSNERN